ncbi:Lim3/4 [Neoconidiobolus thromboides FSU 785]|nr:Lim3/4 [Neoconidiobolus thromboides FSU 785]
MVNYHQPRSRILPSQTLILNSVYKITEFPTRQMRHYLAKILGLPPRSVQIWFQNQRQKKRFGKK